jgi:FkbM family methyltransferase
MNFPGRKFAGHLFWVTVGRFPVVRVWLTRLFVPSRDLDIQMFGATLRINSREEIGLARAARKSTSNIIFRDEVATLLNLALLLQPGDVFVDIGANVGLYSSILSRLANAYPQSRFVAIEPNPETARRLRESVRNAPVTVLNLAVSDKESELAFQRGITSGVFKVAEPGQPIEAVVPCQKLDSLPIPDGDLVLKIDVEDHELQVLTGAEGLLKSGRVKVVYLDGYSSKLVPLLLRRHGFSFFDGRTLAGSDTEVPSFSLLAIHRTRLPASGAAAQNS